MNDFPKWIASALFATVVAGTAAGQSTPDASASLMMPLPAPAPAKEALATLPDTRLWYWDTGGDGAPVVLVHPATGSALCTSTSSASISDSPCREMASVRPLKCTGR